MRTLYINILEHTIKTAFINDYGLHDNLAITPLHFLRVYNNEIMA